MSRRRGEFEHRTSIFEGAFRAWSHLGGLEPEDLESKQVADLDPLTNPITTDPRLNDKKNDDLNSPTQRKGKTLEFADVKYGRERSSGGRVRPRSRFLKSERVCARRGVISNRLTTPHRSKPRPTSAHFLTASRRLRRSRLDRLSSSDPPAVAAAAAVSLSVTASAAPYCHISPLVPCDPPT